MHCYQLTLTHGERRAIDWIGHRYSHGDDLYELLCDCEWGDDEREIDILWDDKEDITFRMPEHKAWEIADLLHNSLLDCFSAELTRKLRDFECEIC